jgi:geranylgeranyl pyrophosphate synthase
MSSTPVDTVSQVHAQAVERALQSVCKTRYGGDDPVSKATAYALESNGKRVRPLLCILAAEATGGRTADALPGAVAVEMVHTYSLVHDDLPCMDDDDLRRGRPTTHKVHGEATALLAGDALLTDAFALLADDGTAFGLERSSLPESRRLAQVRELALAAGGSGMVLGQALDMHWTARGGYHRSDLERVHSQKTGRLLAAAAALGGLAGSATPAQIDALRAFGTGLGLAFQILDDLLDEAPSTGKSRGKDRAAGKLTYLSLMSVAEARAEAYRLTRDAVGALAVLGPAAKPLIALADALLNRTH